MKNRFPNVAVIIPAHNEQEVISKVINKTLETFENVICVDDGSKDNTYAEIKKTKATALQHLTNIGQGGALETGILYALKNPKIDYFITFDADGQHRTEDAVKMIGELERTKNDIVIGSRFLVSGSAKDVPLAKRIMLFFAIIFTRFTTGLKLSDTHNGLRVLNRKFAEQINLDNFGMAHASEFLEMIPKYGFTYSEVPITIDYTDYSKGKGQPIINLVNILFDLFFK